MNGLPQPAYVMSEPHLSGYRVIIGYETLADAQAAQLALSKPQAREEAQPVGMRVHLVRGKNYGNLTIRHWASIGGLTEGEHVLYTTPPAPEAEKLRVAVEAIRAEINAPLSGPTHGAWDRGRIAGLKEALAALQQEGR